MNKIINFSEVNPITSKENEFIKSEVYKIINKKNFILGNEVEIFEKNFAKLSKVKFAVGCGSGTDALILSLMCLNLKKDDEVIVPGMTYISTGLSVILNNNKLVLADIDAKTGLISIDNVKEKITKKTKVILPVHLYGSVANLKEIKKIIKNKKIFLIDDCAQAHGAYDDSEKIIKTKIGSSADISCFSFYPGKNLGAYGDGGIITTNKKEKFKIIKKIRNLGSEKKSIHEFIGVNSRLDTIQAIILNKKLKTLNKHNKKRRNIAKIYNEKILNKKIKKLQYSRTCVYHQYVILVKQKTKLIKLLNRKKIQYGFHYNQAIHQLDAFKNYFKNQRFNNAERLAKEGISIPIDPNLSKKNINFIIETLNSL